MNITGKITGIKYKVILSENLKNVDIKNFDINQIASSCILTDKKTFFCNFKMGYSKRTRYIHLKEFTTHYIFQKITVIPIVKDEGAKAIEIIYNGTLYRLCLY
jgi:hypothetical protein